MLINSTCSMKAASCEKKPFNEILAQGLAKNDTVEKT